MTIGTVRVASLRRFDGRRAHGHNHIDARLHQVGRERGELVKPAGGESRLDGQISTLYVSEIP
jgi:hypothetical protein